MWLEPRSRPDFWSRLNPLHVLTGRSGFSVLLSILRDVCGRRPDAALRPPKTRTKISDGAVAPSARPNRPVRDGAVVPPFPTGRPGRPGRLGRGPGPRRRRERVEYGVRRVGCGGSGPRPIGRSRPGVRAPPPVGTAGRRPSEPAPSRAGAGGGKRRAEIGKASC